MIAAAPPSPPVQRPNPLRQFLRRGLAAALPRRSYLVDGPANCGRVCLTFDDGPHPEHTPRLLDELARHGVCATFFLLGREAERRPALVRRICDEGHAVGNHTWSHRLADELSLEEFADEVTRTDILLTQIAGAPVRLFRPPLGKTTPRQMLHLWRRGKSIVLWNVDPKDYGCHAAGDVAARLAELRGGDLVLLHDSRPFAADVLPELAGRAAAAGLSFATVTEWTGGQSPVKTSGAAT